jgi:nicotinamidase/pyrazinamidase
MQECFVPGSDSVVHSLPVQGGNEIVAGINQLQEKFDLVVATKDWHPKDHGSFASQYPDKSPFEMTVLGGVDQVLWPDHCVQNTAGAEFIAGLNTDKIAHTTLKGLDPEVDSYSGFRDNNKSAVTDLDQYLKSKDVDEIYVVGLAADYCVKATAIDGASLAYKTYFIEDLTEAVDPSKENMEKIYAELKTAGVNIISSDKI